MQYLNKHKYNETQSVSNTFFKNGSVACFSQIGSLSLVRSYDYN